MATMFAESQIEIHSYQQGGVFVYIHSYLTKCSSNQ